MKHDASPEQRHRPATAERLAVAVCAALLAEPADAATPSFDCDRAASQIETLICGDDALASLDMRLARMFARALSASDSGTVLDLRTEQRDWRTGLEECGKQPSPRACVLAAYEARVRTMAKGASNTAISAEAATADDRSGGGRQR